ncbi:two-component sensor histidine kinase [Devosia pacifica]|uniref:histidine kinase n=1 Tax=Devosia pacifica TaxID=1335967 RepID=A0A918S383_9HYPH|nr:ATP-binding protein [Devosia pacifica]GHA22230.1 two-component sensor histidine kinase [Devosia pacifica]
MAPSVVVAQDLKASALSSAAPLAIAIGAGAFAVIAVGIIRTVMQESRRRDRRALEQIASLRALVDEYEALLSGSREVTILWPENVEGTPKILGQASAILPAGRRSDAVLKFSSWLDFDEAERLARLVEGLRTDGHAFETSLTTRDHRLVRAAGWVLGGSAAVRFRPGQAAPNPAAIGSTAAMRAEFCDLLSLLSKPAFLRDSNDRLIFANGAYLRLAEALGLSGSESAPPELIDREQVQRRRAMIDGGEPVTLEIDLATQGRHKWVETVLDGGTAGYLVPLDRDLETGGSLGIAHMGRVINMLATPIAIFGPDKELVQYNSAYAEFWGLGSDFLTPGLDERAILDKLRTDGLLPPVPDYHAWRSQHLTAYKLEAPREDEPWHLPDGRTIRAIAAPAGPKGGVIYVFEDITARLELESTNRALSSVQRESLNALSEAVAVFGTNGRLTLSNPRLMSLWKLPISELGQNPHIDQIAEACGRVMPEDGQPIWRDLKRGIIDLNPTRTDTTGRINRADGRLLDYAITRLPDGQTMMTFLDVTESANYSRVLKERNDALIAADQLKDAFIQNVSYELRSPLTNIIGFADLLAADGAVLSERQRSYTDYIRASSVTLGVLIDNILDLANVDAGIAELKPELQDISALVEKARAGLSATFPEVGGEKPVNLVVDIEDDMPPFVADGTRMVQILYNLLSNAARFSPPGGEIALKISTRGDRMLFVIEDEGPGLTDEMREAIHAHIDAPTAGGRQRGAGLGLTIVRTFVNLHGGTVTAERRDPHGSRLVVNLPRDAALAGVAE